MVSSQVLKTKMLMLTGAKCRLEEHSVAESTGLGTAITYQRDKHQRMLKLVLTTSQQDETNVVMWSLVLMLLSRTTLKIFAKLLEDCLRSVSVRDSLRRLCVVVVIVTTASLADWRPGAVSTLIMCISWITLLSVQNVPVILVSVYYILSLNKIRHFDHEICHINANICQKRLNITILFFSKSIQISFS